VTIQNEESTQYGVGDASYKAAGERAGIAVLVDAFYRIMDELPQARGIRRMHPSDLGETRDKLTRFLCGWLNGPPLYSEKYGPIKLPRAHAHLRVGPDERDAWLACMERAIAEQDYSPEFGAYLLRELNTPAQRIVERSRDPISSSIA
jgi:hemoglobin